MIILVHGDDEYRISERINVLNKTIDSLELRQLNIIKMDADACTVDEVLSAIFALPFMSDKRIVYIENLSRNLTKFGKSDTTVSAKNEASLQDLLTMLPSTTKLVILEKSLEKGQLHLCHQSHNLVIEHLESKSLVRKYHN